MVLGISRPPAVKRMIYYSYRVACTPNQSREHSQRLRYPSSRRLLKESHICADDHRSRESHSFMFRLVTKFWLGCVGGGDWSLKEAERYLELLAPYIRSKGRYGLHSSQLQIMFGISGFPTVEVFGKPVCRRRTCINVTARRSTKDRALVYLLAEPKTNAERDRQTSSSPYI